MLMASQKSLLLGLLLLVTSLALISKPTVAGFNTSEFPPDFYFGSSTSAYQVEGEANKSGKGPSIWDTFTHEYPDRISDRSSGDVADDFYHRYKEDLIAMRETGLNAFRFSISWPRVIPNGQIRYGVNEEGITFYNNLLNEARANGLVPFVTLFHWDTPQALEDKYGGFLSRNIVADFRDFAELCFQRFGDRVAHWITLNEPWAFAAWGYGTGAFAPGRCSAWVNRRCQDGNSATEPYIVTHNLLLAHAATVKLYREKYQEKQKAEIGISLITWWMKPYSNNASDIEATKRALDFMFGWFMDPLIYGNYPRTMRDSVKERLPKFTREESESLRGSIDFLGLNYYSARFVKNVETVEPERISYDNDDYAELMYYDLEGNPIGEPTDLEWLWIAPTGIRELMNYSRNNYGNLKIYITENGFVQRGSDDVDVIKNQLLNDTQRVEVIDLHLGNVSLSLNEDKVNVKGYLAWSFIDNFEWSSGYTMRFALVYVDYEKNLTRANKTSLNWLRSKLTATAALPSPKAEPKWSMPMGTMDSPI